MGRAQHNNPRKGEERSLDREKKHRTFRSVIFLSTTQHNTTRDSLATSFVRNKRKESFGHDELQGGNDKDEPRRRSVSLDLRKKGKERLRFAMKRLRFVKRERTDAEGIAGNKKKIR
jgi:hypothetical protein